MFDTQAGASVAKPAGLRQRGKSWEMRVRVPGSLRARLPTEIVKSFGPISFKDACRRGWAERAAIERLFEETEAKITLGSELVGGPIADFTDAQLGSFASLYLRELERDQGAVPLDRDAQQELSDSLDEEASHLGQPHALNDPGLQSFAEQFANRVGVQLPPGEPRYRFVDAVRIASIEHLNRQVARLSGAPVATINPALADVAAPGGEQAELTLSQAVDMYVRAPERAKNTEKSLKLDRSRLRPLYDILGDDRKVSGISRADLRDFVDKLNRLPAHYTKLYPGMSVLEAIAAGAAAGKPMLSNTSIERAVQAAKSLFRWLESEEVIAKNPALNLKSPKAARSGRRPYEPAELRSLLTATSPVVRGKRDWTYWTARIAMLQGLRLTEPLGLKVGDFFRSGDVLAIRLRPNDLRRLKNEATERDIPVHPRLIELGLEGLLKDRPGDEPLLSDVPRGDGKSFNAAQKQLMRIVRKHVSKDPNLVIHSLRHSFRDAMRDASFPRSVEQCLGGWRGEGSSVMDDYGRGHRLEVLRDWIGKVAYDGVNVQ